MKRISAFALLLCFGMACAVPVAARADQNDARLAAQKHNQKQSHRDMKQQRKEQKRLLKAMKSRRKDQK